MAESSDESIDEYQANIEKKLADPYLLETVRLLNEGCENAKKWKKNKKKEDIPYGVHIRTWDITDVDYNYTACTNYCMHLDAWDVCPDEDVICDSCETILKERISKLPFNVYNNSKIKMINDFISLQKQMSQVLERLSKLEELVKK